ncbi:MAG: hypothetical protein JNM79_25165 [Burkholderiales bacterium]|nr:hypothetical protein [Burkholderiales bacterium]
MRFLKFLFALTGAAILLVVGVVFSLVFFAFAAAAGLLLWAWLAWRGARLRGAADASAPPVKPGSGHVIEGEVVVIHEEAPPMRKLPDRPA